MKRFLALLSLSLLLFTFSIAHAEAPKDKGLLITPLRNYVSIDAGTQKTSSFTVANLTKKPLTVILSVKQFSVQDYAYDYRFSDPNNDWVRLSTSEVTLQPTKSQQIDYRVAIPANTAGGGHYYTLFASSQLTNTGLESTVQAASLLYLTVNGKLIGTSELKSSTLPRFFFGKELSYTLDVKNTGNVHYFAYFSGQLHGPSAHSASGNSHLLLPGAIRHVTSSIPAPLLPGVYRATYGYKTDAGTSISRSRYVVFIPPWSVIALILLGGGGYKLYRFRKARRTHTVAADET